MGERKSHQAKFLYDGSATGQTRPANAKRGGHDVAAPFGTRNRNRTCNYPLGGGYYIHLTMQAYSPILAQFPLLFKGILASLFRFCSINVYKL